MNLSSLAENFQGVRFNIHHPDGRILCLGQEGPAVDWYLHADHTLGNILQRPQRELERSYVRGEWDIDTHYLPALLQALIPAGIPTPLRHRYAVMRHLRALLPAQRGDVPAAHWEDTSLWLSRACLGEELIQGCAHYSEPGISAEQAQRIRCNTLVTRLQLRPGQHLLDLNAGWGSLPLYLAQHAGVRVTALVSNREQLQFAHSEAMSRGLDAAVHFRVGDFRQCQGRFDRIVASGPGLHCPPSTLRTLFERLADLLHEDGMLWLQLAGRRDANPNNLWYLQQPPQRTDIPLLSALHSALEHTRLRTLLLEDLSGYRLQDLRSQVRRYRHRRSAISRRFGEPRTRYWEFGLAGEMVAVQRGQLLQYEMILGNEHCRWLPAPGTHTSGKNCLPRDIAGTIPGLARGI